MYIPQFVRTKNLNQKFTNLMLNCDNKHEFRAYLLDLNLDSKCPVDWSELNKSVDSFHISDDYTLLSIYYFIPSKNDPENKLKLLLTKLVKKS